VIVQELEGTGGNKVEYGDFLTWHRQWLFRWEEEVRPQQGLQV
jgi:hypothetical protein